MADQKYLQVRVRDSQNILYEGEVDRISSFNEVGRFDVYPLHVNFISIIQKEITLYHSNKVVKEIKIEKAIMKVKRNTVHIFLGIEAFVLDPEENEKKK